MLIENTAYLIVIAILLCLVIDRVRDAIVATILSRADAQVKVIQAHSDEELRLVGAYAWSDEDEEYDGPEERQPFTRSHASTSAMKHSQLQDTLWCIIATVATLTVCMWIEILLRLLGDTFYL